MTRPELLSPAGSAEALRAAVENGADAVYLGWGGFNARQNAKNFSDEDFAGALSYCRERGVKVYLTLNTLISDRELPAAVRAAETACALGVDAILIQDLGLLLLLQSRLPDLPLHASTQMSLMTLGGAKTAAGWGCERVVLGRELSRSDVADICRNCPAEVEVFVHGALCMCCSGQCAMSALIGGRSGNRGRCAQPCRLPYSLTGSKQAGHPLSLKDSCLADYWEDMASLGVACLKIEGRMKRPEYVAVVTGIYARLLAEHRAPTAQERETLESAFSRNGFTDGYWTGLKGPEMFGVRPENAAEPKALFDAARAAYEKGGLRTVPVELRCEAMPGIPCSLTADDGCGHCVSVSGDVPESAKTRALTAPELEDRLGKTGGTAYRCARVSARVAPGLFLSAASINALRRKALEALSALRTAAPERRVGALPPEAAALPAPSLSLTCSLSDPAQLTPTLLAHGPARVYLPLEWFSALTALPEFGGEWCAILPRVWKTREEGALTALLKRAVELGVSAVLAGNIGHLSLARDFGLPIYGDFGLNVYNSRALQFWAGQGLASATASFELRGGQLRDLKKCLPVEAILYGRLPLMITETCPTGIAGTCRGEKKLCRKPAALTDRTGARFPLLPAYGCRCEVQNSKPLYLADRQDWKNLGLSYGRLRFTTEPPEVCAEIFRAYQTGGAPPEDFTRGLFDRGVE